MISVIVPVYKVEQYLHRCVDSILAQTYTDFELLLVDDGSPDGCPQICDAYSREDPRVRVIHKSNGGLISARNAGIHAAKGDYVCIVDGFKNFGAIKNLGSIGNIGKFGSVKNL